MPSFWLLLSKTTPKTGPAFSHDLDGLVEMSVSNLHTQSQRLNKLEELKVTGTTEFQQERGPEGQQEPLSSSWNTAGGAAAEKHSR